MQKSIDNARQIYDTCNIIKRIAMNIYTVKNIKTNSIYYCGESKRKAFTTVRKWIEFDIEIEQHFISQNGLNENVYKLKPFEFDIEFARIFLIKTLKNKH